MVSLSIKGEKEQELLEATLPLNDSCVKLLPETLYVVKRKK